MPSLIPLAGEPRTFEVGARAVVGRDPTCEVSLTDPSVSRRHAEIRLLEDGRYEVVDLGSKHGVLVRGEKVERAVLAHGDELRIGLARFRFQAQDPELEAPGCASRSPTRRASVPPRSSPRRRSCAATTTSCAPGSS